MRLNAYLARAGVASRRGADELIKAGRVRLNGRVGQLNDEVSEADRVEVDNKPIGGQKLVYILLNKPTGYLTTLKDPHGRRKVIDLIKIPERIIPVGRLDYDTSGALLLTNDGQLANRLMHPRYRVDKTYEVKAEGSVTTEILDRLSKGVQLDNGITSPAKVRLLGAGLIELTIHEGKNHQVKRMMTVVGLKTLGLHRSGYAGLGLAGLKAGQWRELKTAELEKLKMVQ
jgi:23S rRNA pseudouridine2605 synthase